MGTEEAAPKEEASSEAASNRSLKKKLLQGRKKLPGALLFSGEGHKTRRCRRVTYPESYITKYATHPKINTGNFGQQLFEAGNFGGEGRQQTCRRLLQSWLPFPSLLLDYSQA